MIDQAVILCGGNAERLQDRSRGEDYLMGLPKPLVEVGGQPFVYYGISMLMVAGITDIVLLSKVQDFQKYTDHLKWRPLKTWRQEAAKSDINVGVLGIAELQEKFLLLNGDCLPIMSVMEWVDLVSLDEPLVTYKVVGDRDAGMAVILRKHIELGVIDCGRISDFRNVYRPYIVSGGLHIGTPQGLHRARQFVDTSMFGQ